MHGTDCKPVKRQPQIADNLQSFSLDRPRIPARDATGPQAGMRLSASRAQ
jgi:hypothetical protein